MLAFSKAMEKAVEQRRTRRVPMKLAVRVQGRDPDGTKWEEMTTAEDASAGGVALTLKRGARVGQVLHLTLPLPPRFRQYDLTQSSYRVYGLIRGKRPGNRFGLLFLGKNPPRGAESLPAGLYLMPGDPKPASSMKGFEVVLRIEAEHAPGGVTQEEHSVAENVREREVDAKTTSLPVQKGAILTVEEVAGDFRTRAEVQNIVIAKDGNPLLNLFLLDAPVPDRLLPGADEKKVAPES
ncbi:MAG: PilZ domain-containing protein [Acidobacteria bacterium]|jgi:hypothetical protein|nr:PilZ domain-containing protein [Acidobacteriota bacterium]